MQIADYIGLPFAERGRDRSGCDCWGLIGIIYHERLGIQLPAYDDYSNTCDREAIPDLIESGCQGWMTVSDVQPYDVLVFLIHGKPMHVGLAIDDQRMLHVERGKDSCIERFTGRPWSRRLEGIYRYAG